jgi:hypothetical protein
MLSVALFSVYVHMCFESSVFKKLPWCLARSYLPPPLERVALFADPSYSIDVSTVPNGGRGLFANRRFDAHSFVVCYYGYIITRNEFDWIEQQGFNINTGINLKRMLGGNVDLTCIGIPGFPGSVINHRETPNAQFFMDVQKRTKHCFMKGFLFVKTLKRQKHMPF